MILSKSKVVETNITLTCVFAEARNSSVHSKLIKSNRMSIRTNASLVPLLVKNVNTGHYNLRY